MTFFRKYPFGMTLALSVLILCLTLSQPSSQSTGFINDKVAHFLAFAALVFPYGFARPQGYIPAVIWAIIMGGAIELIQPHVGRQGDWNDFYADLFGILVGIVTAKLLSRFTQGAH